MNENIWLAIIAGLIGGGGLFGLILKYMFEYYSDKLKHERELELKSLEMPLRATLRGLDAQNDMLARVRKEQKAAFVGVIRMSNGLVFADKSHKWSFTCTTFSGNEEVRELLQNRSIYEAGKAWGDVEDTGYHICANTVDEQTEIMAARLLRLNINAYCLVGTKDCLNALLVCWPKPSDLDETSARMLKGELLTIEKYLK